MKLLEFKNVDLIYHTNKSETKALENINFEVDEKEFVAIVGPSGCGKTTILSLLSKLLKPSNGSIIYDDKIKIGYMFQKDLLFDWRTIYKNIILGLEIKNELNDDNKNYINELLEKYGLKDFKNSHPSELSGGMRQRVALIRTLALKPDILLLDEPFSALDFQTRLNVCDDVYNIIKNEQKTAILVTHDIGEAISMADRVIILTNRPATIKKIISIDIDKTLSPFKKRQTEKFNYYFDLIWKELQNNETKEDK
jgi:NitT/TauT family transport system ATP-binding protein